MKDNQESISFAKGTLVFTFESIYYIITTSSGAFIDFMQLWNLKDAEILHLMALDEIFSKSRTQVPDIWNMRYSNVKIAYFEILHYFFKPIAPLKI